MSQSPDALKAWAAIFIFVAIFDSRIEMASVSQAFDLGHPLLMDRKRLDRIVDVMYAEIQKTLFSESPRRRQGTETEQILEGTATSADDVLAEAVVDLLRFSPERLEGTWEGLAVTIAHNKAVDAVRASQKGLRKTEFRPRLRLVSGDAVRQGKRCGRGT